MAKRETKPSDPALENIETVARMDRDFMDQRSASDRAADAIASFAGGMPFVAMQVIGVIAWLLVNTGKIPAIRAFDPFPFVLLAMIVSVEGVLISTFVLMSQNRMTRRADHRNHLNLQIDLLAEKEITKILQVLQGINERLGIRDHEHDTELTELAETTAVDQLADALKKRLPAS